MDKFFYFYCILALTCSAIFAAESEAKERHELTSEDVGAFCDGLIPLQIEQANIAGAVIAVIKDGKLIFAKGYGYADMAKKTRISPEKTLFRLGSISKLFIWTAVMQQVEQGKLDLDRDVNDYLDFKIPPAFDKPITLRDLMTHRPGFDESLKDLFVATPQDVQPLSQYLQAHMPARIFPPGTTPAYSNYASTLAAYIVERVSGQNFNDYVEEHIFKPLDMRHSTFRQPLPDDLKPDISQGYMLASDKPKPFEVAQVWPAGSISSSAVDMTHFMIMNLQNGRYGNDQVLKPETAIQMHARQAGWPDAMNAMCLGFYEMSQNGYRVIGHDGDTILFHSRLALIPHANAGLIISYNSFGQSKQVLRNIFFDKFMDRYFPEKAAPESKHTVDVQSLIGTYEPSRRSEKTFFAVTTLFRQAKICANSKDKTLWISGVKGLNQQPIHFREIGPMVFREVDGKSKIAFATNASGKRVAYTDEPSMVYLQVAHTLDKLNVNYFILGFSLSVVVLTLLAWPLSAMIRTHYAKPLGLDPLAKKLRLFVHLVCLLIVIYVAGLLTFASTISDISMLSARSDIWLRLLQVISLLIGLGSIAVIYNCVRNWSEKQGWFWSRIWNTLQAIACAGFFWFIYHWNLLDWSLMY